MVTPILCQLLCASIDTWVTRLIIGLSFTICPRVIKVALENQQQQKIKKEGGGFVLAGSILVFMGGSVTRLGDFLNFGKLFKAFDNNKYAQISHILRQFL